MDSEEIKVWFGMFLWMETKHSDEINSLDKALDLLHNEMGYLPKIDFRFNLQQYEID